MRCLWVWCLHGKTLLGFWREREGKRHDMPGHSTPSTWLGPWSGLCCPIFPGEEKEVWLGWKTCQMSCSWWGAASGFELRSVGFRNQNSHLLTDSFKCHSHATAAFGSLPSRRAFDFLISYISQQHTRMKSGTQLYLTYYYHYYCFAKETLSVRSPFLYTLIQTHTHLSNRFEWCLNSGWAT